MSKQIADEYSLDIPHVAAVELPLVVNNDDKAIAMLGGKDQISKVVNSNTTSIDMLNSNEKDLQLELRLRQDRFHHPIISSKNTQEKILLKVSIPKSKLPSNYETMGLKTILENNQQLNGKYLIQPVGIINKTYSFKSMNDFQVNTKNNQMITDINEKVINTCDFDTLNKFFQHGKFINNEDFKNPEAYANKDHQLPPPAILSTIRQPYDYQYAKNSLTETIKDPKSGELKVRNKKDLPKLYSIVLDIHDSTIPQTPNPQLIERYKQLTSSQLYPNSFNYDLIDCVKWLKEIFDIKPIWLRKHLEDIVPEPFKRTLKHALPYVTYIYKSGPWRFCNIKIGVDPKSSKDYWIFQSEYFRVSNFNLKRPNHEEPSRILPNSIDSWNPKLSKSLARKVKIDDKLIFQGNILPSAVTYQVGDIIDEDILELIEKSRTNYRFFRDVIDLKQDGWIDRQIIETIRRIIKYKLIQLIKDEPIDHIRISKIVNTVYTLEDEDEDEDGDGDGDEDFDDVIDPELIGDVEAEVEAEALEAVEEDDEMKVEGDQLLNNIRKIDSIAAEKLAELSEFIKQESIM